MKLFVAVVLAAALVVMAMPVLPAFATPRGKMPDLFKKSPNQYCPVDGRQIDITTYWVDYGGKTIGFCCKECKETFKSNPGRYSNNVR